MNVHQRAIPQRLGRCLAGPAGVVVLALASVATAIATAGAPSSPNCPAAPPGWKNPPAVDSQGQPWGKMVVNSGNPGGPGGNTTQVNCNYFDARGRHVDVVVNFAQPTDLNPIADFYFGCKDAVTPWTSSNRMFTAISKDRWSIVAFSDPAGTLQPKEVPGFEQVARRLLRSSEPYAHTCGTKTRPTPVSFEYTYKFSAPGSSASGLFWTRIDPSTLGSVVVRVGGLKFAARVTLRGTRHVLVLTVRRGVAYRPARPGSPGQLRLAVGVVSSSVAGCRTGSAGTLTVSTAPSVRLAVCGQTFLRGRARVTISPV